MVGIQVGCINNTIEDPWGSGKVELQVPKAEKLAASLLKPWLQQTCTLTGRSDQPSLLLWITLTSGKGKCPRASHALLT